MRRSVPRLLDLPIPRVKLLPLRVLLERQRQIVDIAKPGARLIVNLLWRLVAPRLRINTKVVQPMVKGFLVLLFYRSLRIRKLMALIQTG